MKKKKTNLDEISITLTGVAVIIISLFNLFGFFDNLPWFQDRIPKIILTLLGTIFLLFNRKLNRINEEIEKNTSSKSNTLEFDNASEMYEFISEELLNAKTSIEDITWGSYTGYRTKNEQISYENYVKTIDRVCKHGKVMYKEISSLSDKHYFNRSKNLFKYYNYHLRYHNIKSIEVPLISYVIIDRKEVIIGFYRITGQTRPSDGVKYLCIKDENIIKFFVDYYDLIWHKGINLKEANYTNDDEVDKLERLYN